MEEEGPTASIITFCALLLINIFFFGFGAAVQALNEKDVNKKAEEEKDKRAIKLYNIMRDPSGYVNTVQLVVTLVNVIIGGWYLGFILTRSSRFLLNIYQNYLGEATEIGISIIGIIATLLTLVILLYILLTFGVLLPKKIALRYPEKWAYACVNPVYFIAGILRPITGLVTLSANGILRLFGMKPDTENMDVTEDEIISIVNEGHEQGVIEASEAEMITNIIEFGDKEAQDIMTQRTNIIGIDGEESLSSAISVMLEERNSRYPVYEENIDHIIGILHLKDALRMQDNHMDGNRPVKEIEGLLREAKFIPMTRNIDELFKTMQSLKLQMVIVVDEYGQTKGLIAMEDILEEIVGNIMDEYDEDESHIEDKGNDEYMIEGLTPLDDLEELLKIDFAEEEFETLNGFLISKMDKIPEPEDDFDIDVDGYNFKIISVANKVIQQVRVTKLPEKVLENHKDKLEESKEE